MSATTTCAPALTADVEDALQVVSDLLIDGFTETDVRNAIDVALERATENGDPARIAPQKRYLAALNLLTA